jgi:MFS family permease
MLSRLLFYIHQFGRFQRNARLYLISMALSYVTVGIINVLYNLYLTVLGYHTDFIGLVLFIGTLGAALAIFPAGLCIDYFGGKAVLIWSSVLIGITGTGQMLFRTPVPLLVSAFIGGIGGAFVLVVNAPFLSLNSSKEEQPHLFSLNIVIALIATVIGETLGGLLPLWLGANARLMGPLPLWLHGALVNQPQARAYQLALLISGIIALPSFIPLFMMDDDRALYQSNRAHNPDHRGFASWSTPGLQALRTRLKALFTVHSLIRLPSLCTSPLMVLTAMYALIGLGAGLFLPYMNIYFVKTLGASTALFGSIDATANTLNALLTLAAPWVAARAGTLLTLLLPRLLGIPLMLLIGCVPVLPLASVLYPLRQGLTDMSQGILQLFSMEEVQLKHRGVANSSYQAAYQGFWAIGVSLGGVMIQNFGYPSVFISAAVLYCLSLCLIWWRFRAKPLPT